MEKTENKKKELFLFWGIFLVAVCVRIFRFGNVPGGVNQDEAMGAVDAWALSKYGTDRFGVWLPVHFTAWKQSQMSVLLSYLMVPFIKIFGLETYAVRLPMLFVSCASVVLIYRVGRLLFESRTALLVMLLTAINPWHFMQSRWSLDCNLFPHVFLLGFYLLLLGLEKRRYLYLSMVFFGLTFYCYGIAVYSVIPFLVVYAAWCLWKRQLGWKEVLVSVLIFSAVALPEILVMAINFFGWPTVETPFFTMSRFPESLRGNDILFLNFSFTQLGRNLLAMLRVCILQMPDHLFNSIPAFGPMYHISIPFILWGIVSFTRDLFRESNLSRQTRMLALWGFFLTGVWVGIITFEVNVNRINIIFFPLIFLCAYGIGGAIRRFHIGERGILTIYLVCFGMFLNSYFTSFAEDIRKYFNADFLQAVIEADAREEYPALYITGHMDWQYNLAMAEILTQYACKIDASYYQGSTNIIGNREMLPYGERYHFVNVDNIREADQRGLYLIHVSELDRLPFDFQTLEEIGNYVILCPEDA